MNRRKFLQYTIALAVAAPISRLGIATPSGTSLPQPTAQDPVHWIPTQDEVDEWLEYYKLAVRQGCERFADVVLGVPEILEDEIGPFEILVSDQDLFDQAERAFIALGRDRYSVAVTQGAGYEAGRENRPRFQPYFTAPSNEAFGWYNAWATGNRDYLWRAGLLKLPRSPGVTWPNGKRPSSLGYGE